MRHHGKRTGPSRRTANRRGHADQRELSTGRPIRVLRFRAVRDRTGLSRSTIWRLERRGIFPKHRRISFNAVGWLETEVEAWIHSRTQL